MKNEIISKIHSSPYKFSFVLAGGGSLALSDLLTSPGASETVLEASFPYSKEAFDDYLGKKPLSYCHLKSALDLSGKARQRALRLEKNLAPKELIGLSVTASLSSKETKKGPRRFFICAEGESFTHRFSCYFSEESSARISEERFIADCVITIIAKICGLSLNFPESKHKLSYEKTEAKKEWLKVQKKEVSFFQSNKNSPSKLIFPGSFNSLHKGHLKMKAIAEERTGEPLSFEISLSNADKNKLSFYEIAKVIEQFEGKHDYILTNTPTFAEKARLFPKACFVIGFDTLVRIFDPKFYSSKEAMELKLKNFLDSEINFLVFGRKIASKFKTLKDFSLPLEFKERFHEINENEFRDDISSSEIRKNLL